jgi:hypothetical protein
MNLDNSLVGCTSSPETGKLVAALSAAQKEMRVIGQDTANTFFKSRYATYQGCCEALRDCLTKQGLILPVAQPCYLHGVGWVAVATLRHGPSDQWISGMVPLITPKPDMQSIGSALTYAKRQLLLALTGAWVGEEDHDGNDTRSEGETPKPLAKPVKKGGPAEDPAYEQAAKNAIANAENAEKAQHNLKVVELRVRERKVSEGCLARCQAEFDRVWGVATNG